MVHECFEPNIFDFLKPAVDSLFKLTLHLAELPALLAQEKQLTRSLTFIIRTDKETRHGPVLEAMQVAKGLNIEKVVLATDEPSPETGQ